MARIEIAVGGGVGGRLELAVDDLAVEVDEDDVGGLELGVGDATGLDGENAGNGVEDADIAPGEVDELGGGEGAIGLPAVVTDALVLFHGNKARTAKNPGRFRGAGGTRTYGTRRKPVEAGRGAAAGRGLPVAPRANPSAP
jgi:hypothetical protein